MGDRATVIFTNGTDSFSAAVYLHHHGGPGSVYAFLDELNRRNHRCDQRYECARFVQLIGEYLDREGITTNSLGVVNGPASASIFDLSKVRTDFSDNGIYLVNRTVRPVSVRHFREDYSARVKEDEDYPLIEDSAEQVLCERLAAIQSESYGGIREFFRQITAGRLDGD
jgi:hypothetical protein